VDGNDVIYQECKFPTPLSNRDWVYYRKRRVDAAKGMYCLMLRDVPNSGQEHVPKKKGVVRAGNGAFWAKYHLRVIIVTIRTTA
jgi:hypothetical protein